MRGLYLVTVVAASLGLLTAPARAQETLDEIEAQSKNHKSAAESKRPVAQVNGYLDNRFQYSYVNPNAAPLSTVDTPSLQEILEGNVQLKVNLGSKAFIYSDISLIYQNGWLFYDRDGMGGRVTYPEHEVATLRPFVVPSELYVTYSPKPWLNFLLGKKRIVWGPGFAFNPTDLVNPPKDPTDPNFQRAGQWVARIELPFEKFTISTLFAPQVLYQSSGIPYALLKFPSCSVPGCTTLPDDSYHYLLAARLYILLFNTDINLFYFFSNKYNDSFENASRFGGSFSRYFFTDYELHAEALFQFGSGRVFPDHLCATGGSCNPLTALSASKLTDGNVYPRVLVGGRTQFRDESTLSLEYYFQSDGYSDLEFEDFLRLLTRAQRANGQAPTGGTSTALSGSNSGGALPQRFTFDPARRHYLIASYTKTKIKDDFTISAVLIAGLTDLSGTFSPSVSWQTREWLTLSLYGFVPIRGIPVGRVTVNDISYSEYSLVPIDFRVLFEARAFY